LEYDALKNASKVNILRCKDMHIDMVMVVIEQWRTRYSDQELSRLLRDGMSPRWRARFIFQPNEPMLKAL